MKTRITRFPVSLALACLAVALLAAPSAARAETKLKWKVPDGRKTVQVVEVELSQSLQIAGMDVDTGSEQTVEVASTNGKRDAQGKINVDVQVKSMKMALTLPGGVELEFDSSKESEPQGTQFDVILEMLPALIKSVTTITLDSDNSVVDVKVQRDAVDKLDDTIQAMINPRLDPDYLKSTANTEYDRIPSKAISKGDTWIVAQAMRVDGGQTLTFTTEYTYIGVEEKDGKKLHRIDQKVKTIDYTIDNPASPLSLVEHSLKVESSKGSLWFDAERGDIVQGSSEVRITGGIKFEVNGQELPATLDLKMSTKQSIKS